MEGRDIRRFTFKDRTMLQPISDHQIDRHIGNRIRAARIDAMMSQTALGRAIGVTFQQIQKYEKGANQVAPARMVAIARALDRPLLWFFEGLPTCPDFDRAPRPTTIDTLASSKDGHRLAKAFIAIRSKRSRAVLLDLAENIAASEAAIVPELDWQNGAQS